MGRTGGRGVLDEQVSVGFQMSVSYSVGTYPELNCAVQYRKIDGDFRPLCVVV